MIGEEGNEQSVVLINKNETIEEKETEQVQCFPWRRYFARGVDSSVYGFLWAVFLTWVMNENCLHRNILGNILDGFVASILMLAVEPFLISLFGTTLGKWLWGIRVTDYNGEHLSLSKSFLRTWQVFLYGLGLAIPIVDLVCGFKSYRRVTDGEKTVWEEYSKISLRDKKGWRIAVYIASGIILYGFLYINASLAEMPKNRGDITVVQFEQNYSRLSDYFGYRQVDDAVGDVNDVIDIGVGDTISKPKFEYTEEGGIMTGLSFSQNIENSDLLIPNYQDEMLLAIMSFVRAQEGCNRYSKDMNRILREITEKPFESFQYTAYGVTMECQVEYSGYLTLYGDSVLYPDNKDLNNYSFSFKMYKK